MLSWTRAMSQLDEDGTATPRSRQELELLMAETLESGDIVGHFEAQAELQRGLVFEAQAALSSLRFEDAADSYHVVAELNRRMSGALAATADAVGAGPMADQLREWKRHADHAALIATGQSELMRGQFHNTRRNPGEAASRLERAEHAFREAATAGDEIGIERFLGDYCAAVREAATAAEELIRADYGAAAASYMRAGGAYRKLVQAVHAPGASEALAAEFVSLAPTIELEAIVVAAQYEKASYMESAAQGDYEAAEESAANLTKLLKAGLDASPEGVPEWQTHALRAQLASAEADRARAGAFVSRTTGDWDGALAAYREARTKLRDAAGEMLQSRLPDAVAAQESLMATASVTIAGEIRQCREEQRLRKEVARLRDERDQFVARIAAAGVSVTNIQEATAVAEQTTQVTLRVEQSVRDQLPALRAAIEAAGPGLAADGERLKSEAAALEASEEHSVPFLERAKAFTERVAGIVKNVGEAAAPVVPVLRLLAPLVGVPLPF